MDQSYQLGAQTWLNTHSHKHPPAPAPPARLLAHYYACGVRLNLFSWWNVLVTRKAWYVWFSFKPILMEAKLFISDQHICSKSHNTGLFQWSSVPMCRLNPASVGGLDLQCLSEARISRSASNTLSDPQTSAGHITANISHPSVICSASGTPPLK